VACDTTRPKARKLPAPSWAAMPHARDAASLRRELDEDEDEL
jgi:hypothetical protein